MRIDNQRILKLLGFRPVDPSRPMWAEFSLSSWLLLAWDRLRYVLR